MMFGPDKIRVAQCGSKAATFDLKLPAGEYLFNGYGTDEVQGMGKKLTLRADQPDLDLATIHLKASPLGQMYGKEPPPLHITDARGISREIKLSDFRGKWVILDFWGYWCGPCVSESLPDLMEIYDAHPADRDKFVVLAFHSKDIASFEELDPKLKPIVESTWGGRELPFPILLDSTGQTVEAYGIQSLADHHRHQPRRKGRSWRRTRPSKGTSSDPDRPAHPAVARPAAQPGNERNQTQRLRQVCGPGRGPTDQA